MIFMGIIEHGWNICLPAFGLGGLSVTFGWGPIRILLFVPCAGVLLQRWVDFRVVSEKLNYYLALYERCAEATPTRPPATSTKGQYLQGLKRQTLSWRRCSNTSHGARAVRDFPLRSDLSKEVGGASRDFGLLLPFCTALVFTDGTAGPLSVELVIFAITALASRAHRYGGCKHLPALGCVGLCCMGVKLVHTADCISEGYARAGSG